MTVPTCTLIRVTENSQRGEARRRASAYAEHLGFDDERGGRVALVATELASNLVKHAPRGGSLFISLVEREGAIGVDLVALDAGPGIADERKALEDGFSTAGSAGIGLGAIARLSDSFDLYSSPGKGTVVASRILRDAQARTPKVSVGGVCGMMEGESVSGDDFAIRDVDGRTRIVVADGLGHGSGAAEASAEAIRIFNTRDGDSVGELLDAMHRSLRPTRGAAVAIAELDPERRVLTYAGLGNVTGVVAAVGHTRNLVSHNGTVGHAMRRIQEFTYELPEEAVVVLHSDGITSRWSLDPYAGLSRRSPAVTASVLYRDFLRGRDDATAVVARLS
jgi:anti-sigma regulatory factor (Ser/Thr protein kinase)